MRVLTASERALLVELPDLAHAMRLNLALRGTPGITECVPGARTVLIRFDPLRTSAAALDVLVRGFVLDAGGMPDAGSVVIPVRYDGEDLAEVAELLGMSEETVIRRHLAARWQVAFAGFAPGFGYLVGDDRRFDVPRRASPRTRVPAGAVALAGEFTGVYPRESPGGWQLIGRTDAVMWDPDRSPPALLAPGTLVRFELADREIIPVPPLRAAVSHTSGAARLEVLQPGVQLLVQDTGRPGHAALGVSASGVADRAAMREANLAVGNPRTTPVLECVGPALMRYRGPASVAVVTGADVDGVRLDREDRELPVETGVPFPIDDGDELHLAHPVRGLRAVIGVRGGFLPPLTLGSGATDTLGGLGPAPLHAGSVIDIGDPRDVTESVLPDAVPRALPASGDVVVLDVTLGPRDDWFTEDGVRTLLGQLWSVTARSDRVGIRLSGDMPLERARHGELPSEGMVTGALQVPPDGQPVLFLPDHPVTGGYPIIATVTDACLDLAGQLPPGVQVRFRAV